jgi:triosephosphate isomerase
MLLEAGVRGVIVGYSERRRLFAESDAAVQLKVAAAVATGLVAILCVGESEEQCQLRETEHRLRQQLRSGLALVDTSRLGEVVIAYEPIWTIETGRMAELARTQEVGALVRGVVAERSSEQATRTRVLYGGSVSTDTAATLLALEDVDGLLVGEPSLDADLFLSILNAARS